MLSPDLDDLSATNSNFTVDQGTYHSSNRTQVAELVVLQSFLETLPSGNMTVTCEINDTIFEETSSEVELFLPCKSSTINSHVDDFQTGGRYIDA